MPYSVGYKESAAKDLEKIAKPDRERIRARIAALADNPRPPGCKKLKGEPELWRIRVGDYRVLYNVQDAVLVVLVVEIGHRREVYR